MNWLLGLSSIKCNDTQSCGDFFFSYQPIQPPSPQYGTKSSNNETIVSFSKAILESENLTQIIIQLSKQLNKTKLDSVLAHALVLRDAEPEWENQNWNGWFSGPPYSLYQFRAD